MDVLATTTETETATDGQTPMGALFISVKNISNAPVTVNGVSLPAGEAKTYPFIGKGYQPITYQLNAHTIRLLFIQ